MPLGYLYDTRGEDVRRLLIVAYLVAFLFAALTFADTLQRMASVQNDAQTQAAVNSQRLSDLTDRVQMLEQARLSDRITRVEAVIETDHNLLLAIMGAIAIMMIESVLRLISVARSFRKPPGVTP